MAEIEESYEEDLEKGTKKFTDIEKMNYFDSFIEMLSKKYNCNEKHIFMKKYKNVFIQKMLYMTCLESISKKDFNLFSIFDNFLAFEKGPVEIEIMNMYNDFLEKRISFDNKKMKNDPVEKMIERSLELLFQEPIIKNIITNDTKKIIEMIPKITQKFPTWIDAFYTSSRKMNLKNTKNDLKILKKLK